jgi:hypothetical protein
MRQLLICHGKKARQQIAKTRFPSAVFAANSFAPSV